MKKIWPFFIALMIVFACNEDQFEENDGAAYEIEQDARGEVASYKLKIFSKGFTADEEFFDIILSKADADQFELEETGVTAEGVAFSKYYEYFQGIQVKEGQYTIYRKNGVVVAASGTYIRIGEMDTNPSVDQSAAINAWCRALNTSVPGIADVRIKLLILATEDNDAPSLVYRIYLRNIRPANTSMGFIDASSAQVLATEPIFIF
jgi:Zn-dependent metalloprotease